VPPLVLLHGWTATAALNWGPSFRPLGEDFRVLALDQRGHGRGISPSRLRGFRLEDCADDVVALADALAIDRIVPVGYSLGGPVAQLTWRRHPDRVAGLVLCATARNFRGSSQPAMAQLAVSGGLVGAAAALRTFPPRLRRRATMAGLVWRKRALGMPDWALDEVARNDPAALLEGFRALQTFNSAEWIGGVDVPTAVVVTTGDRIVPPSRQRKLAEAVPGATVWPVDGDHDVCVASPRLFAPALVEASRWVTRSERTLSGRGAATGAGR
jgi:3-oxoadipate enol-lactonase